MTAAVEALPLSIIWSTPQVPASNSDPQNCPVSQESDAPEHLSAQCLYCSGCTTVLLPGERYHFLPLMAHGKTLRDRMEFQPEIKVQLTFAYQYTFAMC